MGSFLCYGPTLRQVREILSTVRWVVTDMGVEGSMADAYDCTESWWHWVLGLPSDTAPGISTDSFLLPLAIFIPGWHHLRSHILKTCCYELHNWPARLKTLRSLTKFLRVADYRHVWGHAIKRVGEHEQAEQLFRSFEGSLLHWRFETLPQVVTELCRLSNVCTRFLPRKSLAILKTQACCRKSQASAGTPNFGCGLMCCRSQCK